MTPTTENPLRVSYQNGMLLDASDFQQEQNYNRTQLARALAQLHGFGTLAGLKVEYLPAVAGSHPDEEIVVNPGLALDRDGHLIEVKTRQCLRLAKWFDFQQAQPGITLKPYKPSASVRDLVGDLFLRFVECPQGLRPGFPEPAADATDALVASRINEGFELLLVARDCDPENNLPKTPVSRFAGTPATPRALLDAIYAAYPAIPATDPQEYPPDFKHKSAVFLSRVRIPVGTGATFARDTGRAVTVEDLNRPVIPPADLLRILLPA